MCRVGLVDGVGVLGLLDWIVVLGLDCGTGVGLSATYYKPLYKPFVLIHIDINPLYINHFDTMPY